MTRKFSSPVLLSAILLFFFCAGCQVIQLFNSPTLVPTQPAPPASAIPPTPTALVETPTVPEPPDSSAALTTPTALNLPFNPTSAANHEFCQPPAVLLALSDAQGLSDEEIASRLMTLWLGYFNTPQAPGFCRVDGISIENVYEDPRSQGPPLEPKGDIMRVVQFSVKLVQLPNFWQSWAGSIDQQNWLHTACNLAIFRSADGYTMQFANP